MSSFDIKKEIISALSDFPELSLAIVYGSFAKERQTAASDVDIAVAGPQVLSAERRVEIALRISKRVKREVDLVDLRRTHGVILKEILKQGTVLIKKDNLLYAQILKRFLFDQEDFMPLFNRILRERREKFLHES